MEPAPFYDLPPIDESLDHLGQLLSKHLYIWASAEFVRMPADSLALEPLLRVTAAAFQ